MNGRRYPLRFTLNALCNLEGRMGMGLEQLLCTSLSALRGLLWCGMVEEQPELTLEQAGWMLESHLKAGGSLEEIAFSLSAAMEEAGFFQLGERKAVPPPL